MFIVAGVLVPASVTVCERIPEGDVRAAPSVRVVMIMTYIKSGMMERRTGRKTASEEHVEEILRRDVGLEASVEFESSVSTVSRAAGLFPSAHIVLPPLLGVTQHGVRVPDLYTTTSSSFLSSFLLSLHSLRQ